MKTLCHDNEHMHQQNNYSMQCFLCSPCCVIYSICSERKKQVITSSQNLLLVKTVAVSFQAVVNSTITCLFLHSAALDATASDLYSLAISTGSIHLTGDTIPSHLHHTPRSAGWTGNPDTRARQVTIRPATMAAICLHLKRYPRAVISICRARRYTNMRPATKGMVPYLIS